ncbi:MAG TPA: hypothetical protein VF898_13720 [Chloroflexota bacterium]
MTGNESQNGHAPSSEPHPVNPYLDMASGAQPPEIAQYEMRSDPYGNMLPGISNINAARSIGEGLDVGRRGNWLILIVSLFLLAVLLLPAILAILAHV